MIRVPNAGHLTGPASPAGMQIALTAWLGNLAFVVETAKDWLIHSRCPGGKTHGSHNHLARHDPTPLWPVMWGRHLRAGNAGRRQRCAQESSDGDGNRRPVRS